MIEVSLNVKGLDKAIARLTRLERKIRRISIQELFSETMERLHRFAVDVSPFGTGAYQSAHRLVVGRSRATLSIDPTARNPVSGELVTRYAAAVEAEHQVYARTAAKARALGPTMAKKIHRILQE